MRKILVLSLTMLVIAACKEERSKINYEQLIAEEPSSNLGRYKLLQLGTMRRDQFLLDTATGRMWTNVCPVPGKGLDCKYSYWSEEDVSGLNKKVSEIVEEIEYARGKEK